MLTAAALPAAPVGMHLDYLHREGRLVVTVVTSSIGITNSVDSKAPCNTENPAKWLFVTPYKSTFNQLVEEVVVTATL